MTVRGSQMKHLVKQDATISNAPTTITGIKEIKQPVVLIAGRKAHAKS